MSASPLECPGCGAVLEIKSVLSRVIVCQYCNQCARIESQGLSAAGENQPLLDSPSKLQIGQEGQLLGSVYRILGRLRFAYDGGFWDEWFLLNDADDRIWLQEDDGELTAFRKVEVSGSMPDYQQCAPGSMIQANGLSLFVMERAMASIVGAQGELFFSVVPGERVGCVDANASGTGYSIEYTDDQISLSQGTAVSMDELDFQMR